MAGKWKWISISLSLILNEKDLKHYLKFNLQMDTFVAECHLRQLVNISSLSLI